MTEDQDTNDDVERLRRDLLDKHACRPVLRIARREPRKEPAGEPPGNVIFLWPRKPKRRCPGS